MKIAVASDLHLEFGDLDIKNTDGAEVLILSGDILTASELNQHDPLNTFKGGRSNQLHNFMSRCSERFPHVIFIAGNHEHYHGDFATTGTKIKRMLESNGLSNVHLLDREIQVIDGVTFIGGTLWTDMNDSDPLTLRHMKDMMNDFRCVDNSNRTVSFKSFDATEEGRQIPTFRTRVAKFSPEDAVEEHIKMKDYIQHIIEGKPEQKFVVVGHHAPSKMSTHEMYKDDTIMNGGYSSSLDDYILDHPQIKLWTHGHTHHVFDYMIGSTRVLCNPRGYDGYEDRADQWQLITVDV